MKPTVDNSLPESMYHPFVKAKKEQMIEGKCIFNPKILEINTIYAYRKV